MEKILVCGASGFVGSYLVEHLLQTNAGEITGTYHTEASLAQLSSVEDKIKLVQIDFTDSKAVHDLIQNLQPTQIYHLASLSSAAESFADPAKTLSNNTSVVINVLEAVREVSPAPKILLVTSADPYGIVAKDNLPIDESTPFMPTSPYAVSKITQDYLGLEYFLAYKLPIIRVRPFNHIGPRQGPGFAIPAFCRKIALIEKGKMEPVLTVGKIDTIRDFTDVRDIVQAYTLLMEKGNVGDVYNLGSGTGRKIADVLDMLVRMANMSIEIKTDSSLFRPNDPMELVCDNTKVKQAAGWQPTTPLEQTFKETLDYWRKHV